MNSLRLNQRAHLSKGPTKLVIGAAIEGHRSIAWPIETKNHPQGGGLPRPVWSEESGDHTWFDIEGEVVDGSGGAVVLGEVPDFDHCWCLITRSRIPEGFLCKSSPKTVSN